MDDRSLKLLEFFRLLEILKEYSISPLGRKRCEALRPSQDLHQIRYRLTEVMELKNILEKEGEIPLQGLKEMDEILKKLEVKGTILTLQELLEIHQQIVLSKGIKRFFQKIDPSIAPHLRERALRLSSQKGLEKEIFQAIHPKGEILDRASPKLLEIRLRLGMVRERAKGVLENILRQESLQSIFQENFITLRNGRYVLLIKSEFKHRLEGIIHDQSQSRMTFFLEPLQVVDLNNEVNLLMGEEKEEEYRILAALSEKVREERQNLWNDLEILGELDLLSAMAKLTLRLKGVSPLLNEGGEIEMRAARNPILAIQREDQVVPIHLRMGREIKILIISGANAGGKTVALKTLGLLTLMVQSGLPIPVAEGSQVSIFQEIFAVIGDEQNMEENVSTFSSHLLHVNQILEKSGPHSLILLDELGAGTHAQEGCALAMGFLDCFRERGSSVVVTTHFDWLKIYGYLHPGVENVAVEFDEVSLEPKYTLLYGSSGVSNAFLIAEKLGISKKVLESARSHQGGGEEEITRALEVLERVKRETESEKWRVLKLKEETWLERQRLKKILETIKERRHEIFSKAEEKARKAIQKMEEELKEWTRSQKQEKVSLHLKQKELYKIKEKNFPPLGRKEGIRITGGLKVGDHVRIDSLRSNGILMNIVKPLNQAEVLVKKVKVKAPLSEIFPVVEMEKGDQRETIETYPLGKKAGRDPLSELNVIGLTVEEAIPMVDKFIDQALLHGLERVQIIHGLGSGRLRNAIGQYLRGNRGVKGFSPGEMKRGGHGVTIVELR